MTKTYGVNWDARNINGIIFNDKYPNGSLFKGATRKPSLSFTYLQFIYSEANNIFNIALIGDKKYRAMTRAEKEEIRAVAIAWTQQEGEEGNPSLVQAKDVKKATLSAVCKTSIEHGFLSDALTPGTPELYRCSQTDQSNLQALIIAQIDFDFELVTDDDLDTREVRPHTVAQLQKVFNDGLTHVATHRAIKRNKCTSVDAIVVDETTSLEDAKLAITAI